MPRMLQKRAVLFALLGLAMIPLAAGATPCVVPDQGGTVNLPPAGCGYLSPADVHMILDSLPLGTTVHIGVQHLDFFNVAKAPGGDLGGERETFNSVGMLHLTGTGSLSGLNRTVSMNLQCVTDVAPHTPGQPVQSFDTEMFGLQGQITGDPDFDLLRITAGNAFGMPSPGHTTLTRQPGGGNWAVDSFFDITYKIEFVGNSSGPLGGHHGSTTGTIRMQAGNPPPVGVEQSTWSSVKSLYTR